VPIYEFECAKCNSRTSLLCSVGGRGICPSCGKEMKRLQSAAAIIIAGNMGPKLRTRVALDDEMKKQGFSSPLFSSELRKDKCRWLLKKAGALY